MGELLIKLLERTADALKQRRRERLRLARDARKDQIERLLEAAAATTATRLALVPVEMIGRALDLPATELQALLGELRREGRIFRDSCTGRYSIRETPWDRGLRAPFGPR